MVALSRSSKAIFGSGSGLTFLAIEPKCKAFEKPHVNIEIGDQTDPIFFARRGG